MHVTDNNDRNLYIDLKRIIGLVFRQLHGRDYLEMVDSGDQEYAHALVCVFIPWHLMGDAVSSWISGKEECVTFRFESELESGHWDNSVMVNVWFVCLSTLL